MKELWRQLLKAHDQSWPTRQKGASWLPSRSWRYSWGLEEEDQALEVRQQNRWSWSGRRTCSRGRSGLRWHQNPTPLCPSQCQSPSPALHDPFLLMSGSTTPWRISSYSSSLSNPRTGHSSVMPPHRRKKTKEAGPVTGRQRVGQGTGLAFGCHPLHSGGCSPRVKEHYQFDCWAIHTYQKPSEQPYPNRAAAFPSQSCSQSQARLGRGRPDTVRYHHNWIAEQMSQPSNPHPHWWREIKASGKLNLGRYCAWGA